MAAATETFQPAFDFTTTSIAFSGTFPEEGYAIPFSGSAAATPGTGDYSTSRTQGEFSMSNIQGSGTWNAFGVDWGTFTVSSGQASGTDNNGTVVANSGTGTFTIKIYSDKTHEVYYNGPLDFTMAGSFNAAEEKFSLKGTGPKSDPATLNLSGGFTVASSTPYTISVGTPTPAWTQSAAGQSPALQVDVAVTRPVHTASSYTSPVGSVSLYWANASGAKVSSTALSPSIAVDWDEASGTYNITGLPLPPSTAQDILLVPVSNGKTGTPLAVPLPARPVLGIAGPAAPVVRPKSGTTPAVFTVTLPAPSPFPVTVQYATVSGTAKSITDFTAVSGTLTFAPGVTSHTITVTVKANSTATAVETFSVELAKPTWATLNPNDTQAVCTIDPYVASSTKSVLQSPASYFAAQQRNSGDAPLNPAAIDAILAETS